MNRMNQPLLTEWKSAKALPADRLPVSVTSAWQSPSNIALVKYWGKKDGQLPLTPSLSMTLQHAVTRTRLKALLDHENAGSIVINGDPSHSFIPKIASLLSIVSAEFPFLKRYSFGIETKNTFPFATGIASSASGLSAFALCLLEITAEVLQQAGTTPEWYACASSVARLGSGSACRSVYGGFTVWGETSLFPAAADAFAIPVNDVIHPDFHDLQDAIVLVSDSPKSMSSSKGHLTMRDHFYTQGRVTQAHHHLSGIAAALANGDVEQLAVFTETEALSLHALMMSHPHADILLLPETLAMILSIRKARKKGLPVFFTLDAGPNVHVLYPSKDKGRVLEWIKNEVTHYYDNQAILFDERGNGPLPLSPHLSV